MKGVKILGFYQFSKIDRPKTNGPIGLKFDRLTEGVRVRGSTKFGSCRPMRLPVGGRQNGGPRPTGFTRGRYSHQGPRWLYVPGSTWDLSGVSVSDNGT